MRTVLFWTIVALGAGCGQSPSERLDGWWESTSADGRSGVFLGFDNDKGTYTAQRVRDGSDGQVEIGVYTATDSAITFGPLQSTCPGPIPITVQMYTLSNGILQIPNSPWAQSLSSTFAPRIPAVSTGCYESGVFASRGLAPVRN